MKESRVESKGAAENHEHHDETRFDAATAQFTLVKSL
jgi:hypothetical protein